MCQKQLMYAKVLGLILIFFSFFHLYAYLRGPKK